MEKKELKATTQKSYYGKAIVIEDKFGNKRLKSYKTIVAEITKKGRFKRLWEGYSQTTMNHINEFRRENGLEKINAKEWKNIEVEKESGKIKRWVYVLRDAKKKTSEIFEMEQKRNVLTRALRKEKYGNFLALKSFIEIAHKGAKIYLSDNAVLSVEQI